MRLFIAEKPSLARAIADALPGKPTRARTHIECGGGDVIAWCAGHILRAAPPEAYGAQYKTWRLEHLPLAPQNWKLEVSVPELLQAIKRLLGQASRVVHAGDPDREGQLLVDEVLDFLGYRGPVERLLIRDLSPEAVRRAIGALEPNATYRPLSESALARQRADWLYGMNMTRLYTLLGRAAGYEGVLSVGRVQTPLLGLIVARDRAIAAFQPATHYVVRAEVLAGGEEKFEALWIPPQDALDADGRLLAREVAQAACQRAAGREGRVVACAEEKKREAPPLPHALADLQVDAGSRLGMSAQAVLDACQSLYETHRLITYPRSDCAHLPEGQFAQAADVLASVARRAPALRQAVALADVTLRSNAWNDKKVTAHHAIIPTPGAQVPTLTDTERAVYELVCRRYVAQFHPPHESIHVAIELDVAGDRFVARGRWTVALGWRVVATDPAGDGSADAADGGDAERESAAPLPRLSEGARVGVKSAAVLDKRTSPPKAFTDGSLIAAMCAVGKFVTDPAVKKILTETDGIGTPATRAAIIETLFERGYVERAKRAIVSTETGRSLIRSLPESATTPDMTAAWEAALRAIAERRQTCAAFLERVEVELGRLVAEGRALGSIAVAGRAPRTNRVSRAPRSHRAARFPRKRKDAS